MVERDGKSGKHVDKGGGISRGIDTMIMKPVLILHFPAEQEHQKKGHRIIGRDTLGSRFKEGK